MNNSHHHFAVTKAVGYGLVMLFFSFLAFKGTLLITEGPPTDDWLEIHFVGLGLVAICFLCLYVGTALLSYGYLHTPKALFGFFITVGIIMLAIPFVLLKHFSPKSVGHFLQGTSYWFSASVLVFLGAIIIRLKKRR